MEVDSCSLVKRPLRPITAGDAFCGGECPTSSGHANLTLISELQRESGKLFVAAPSSRSVTPRVPERPEGVPVETQTDELPATLPSQAAHFHSEGFRFVLHVCG